MGAKNKVIAGDNMGKMISQGFGIVQIGNGVRNETINISSYEVITEDKAKSAASGIGRGLVGGALLGPVGAIAGIASAKNKGIYTVAIEYDGGKKSLVEINDKIYKAIVATAF